MTAITAGEKFRILETTGMMSEDELTWIAETVSGVKSWTEVGVYCGRSALAAALSLPPGGLLQLVDVDFRTRFYPNLEWILRRRHDITVTLCSAPSVDAAKLLPETEGVFIDDNHTYAGVHDSITAWQGRCRILCGHDYSLNPPHAGVSQAVNELCSEVLFPAGTIWLRKCK